MGGRGVLPRRWWVLKKGLRGAAIPNGPGTRAWGDAEACPGGGRCSRRACGGQQLTTAPAHQPGRTGSPAQAVVGAEGGPAGGVAVPNGPGTPALRGRGVLPRRWSVL